MEFEPLGNLVKWEAKDDKLYLWIENAEARIQFPAAGVARVQVKKPDEEFLDSTYSIPHHGQISFDVIESDENLEITLPELQIHIHKTPVRIDFFNEAGELLCADDPSFGIAWQGTEVSNYKILQDGERFLGMGEKTGPLDRRGNFYTHWNSDQFGYGGETDPLYFSCPFYIGLAHDRFYGIFLDNTYESRFNFGASNDRFSFFQSAGGQLNYYFFAGTNPAEIVKQYTSLTGREELPPLWSLGYQQCRYSYYPAHELMQVARTFREKKIPADVLYLDIHYMDHYKVFTWHPERFQNPAKMLAELKEMGFRVVVILDPGIKIEEGYEAYESGKGENVFITYPDKSLYRGQAWPGWCHFPDFTQKSSRSWWSGKVAKLAQTGVSGFWNDMNEPAVWGKHFPDLAQFSFENKETTHKEAHNVYGMQMSRATYEGARQGLNNQRPFVLTRAGFSGSQRYARVWTGDNVSNDEHIFVGCRLVNAMGLSGLSFTGNDIGGFIGESNPRLFMRWIALGAFHPLFRGHTMVNSRDAEPWAFGEEAEEVARNYISLRYRMLSYLYSLHFEASNTGLPPVRSLAFYFSSEWKIFQSPYDSQFLLGESLLIRPVASNDELVKVYLPAGKWYDLFTDKIYEGSEEHIIETPIDKLPVFARGGHLFTLQPQRQFTAQKVDGPLEIHLYAGEESQKYIHYEDDGVSYDYQEKKHLQLELDWNGPEQRLSLKPLEKGFKSPYQKLKIFLHGIDPQRVKMNEKEVRIQQMDYRFVEPISNFDPWEWEKEDPKIIKNLPFVEIPYPNNDAVLSWD